MNRIYINRKKIMDNPIKKNFELKVDNTLIFAVVGMVVFGKVAREAVKAIKNI